MFVGSETTFHTRSRGASTSTDVSTTLMPAPCPGTPRGPPYRLSLRATLRRGGGVPDPSPPPPPAPPAGRTAPSPAESLTATNTRPGGDHARGTRPASTAYPAKKRAFFTLNLVAARTRRGPAIVAAGHDHGS